MDDDWFVAALDAMGEAAEDARATLAAVARMLEPVRQDRLAGLPLAEILERMSAVAGPSARTTAMLALRRYEQSVHAFRAGLIGHLVEDEGFTLSDAARCLHISRQRAARLLSSAHESSASALRPATAEEPSVT